MRRGEGGKGLFFFYDEDNKMGRHTYSEKRRQKIKERGIGEGVPQKVERHSKNIFIPKTFLTHQKRQQTSKNIWKVSQNYLN